MSESLFSFLSLASELRNPDRMAKRSAARLLGVQRDPEFLSACPKCGGLVEDPDDGFGVLFHDECGYCSHPDAYGGACSNCGATI